MTTKKNRIPSFNLPPASNTFLTTQSGTFSYNDLFSFTAQLDEKLKGVELDEDHPLLIFAENRPEIVFLIAACFLKQIPILPVNPEISPAELANLFHVITPGAYVSVTGNKELLPKSLKKLQLPDIQLINFATKTEQIFSFDAPDSAAGYFLTSGSTGMPKVLPIKRRQVFFAASSSSENFKPGKNKYWLLCLPLNHVGGINVIYRSLLYHSAIYLVSRFDVEEIRGLLHENKSFEAASMVPTMLTKLLDHTFFRVQFQFKALLLGGGPISMNLINTSLTRGLPIVTSYGMTETCAQIAANPMLQPSGAYIPKKSVGSIFSPNEIEIRDENGNSLPFNETGQIWLRGPQVFDGYYANHQNQYSFDSDGWFNTGDYGHLNRKKHLFIENRRTDIIITGGENVNPVEIEEVINEIIGVKEAAVIGVPDEKWGQMVVAFVVLSDPDVGRNDIKKFLKSRLVSYKVPKQIISVPELPKTSTHKVIKPELLTWYLQHLK